MNATLTYIKLFSIFTAGLTLAGDLLLINLKPEYLKHSVKLFAL